MDGPRLAASGDFPSMLALLDRCFAANLPEGMERHWPHVLPRRGDSGVCHVVFTHEGRVVSCAAIVPMRLRVGGGTLDVGGVSCVATDPDCRGRGLMTAVLDFAETTMRQRGFAASWLNGDRTRYRRFGYERAGRKLNIVITPRSFADAGGSVGEVVRFDGQARQLDSIVRIYEQRGVGGIRDETLWRRLVGRPGKEAYLATHRGEATAYLFFERKQAEGHVEVFEYGGDPAGVHALLGHCFDALGVQRMEVSAPCVGDPVADLLAQWAQQWSLGFSGWFASGGMMRVLDLGACLGAFLPQLIEKRRQRGDNRSGAVSLKLNETGQGATLRFGEGVELIEEPSGDCVAFGESELAGFLFGLRERLPCPKPLELLASLLPLDFHIWPLEMV